MTLRAERLGELDRGGADAGVPPCTSSVSPLLSAPRSNTLCQTVKNVSGIAAASTIESAGGTGSAWLSCARQYSRVAAADHQRHDLVAELPARDAGAERDHLAGDLEAGNVGRALAAADRVPWRCTHVGPVDAGGRDLDQDFAGAGRRHRALLRHQHLRAAGRADGDRGHAGGQRAHDRPRYVGCADCLVAPAPV